MDYVEAFKDLKPNEKYGRKTPHKAVLLLTIMEMYELNVICSNEIRYNQVLIDTFRKVWRRTLPYDNSLFVDAFIPFWTMQNESFWHIVPLCGKEDIVEMLKERHVRPSEKRINECIDYVELDEDLFFLMTLPSGRTSLKRALLENYSTLTDSEIEKIVINKDNSIDNSSNALAEYKKILSIDTKKQDHLLVKSSSDGMQKSFDALNEDIQIQLNIEFYTFLKEHKMERDLFKEFCPTVLDLYDRISLHPVKQGDIPNSLFYLYENFLMDLKINLLGIAGGLDLLDDIENAIRQLHDDSNERVADSKIDDCSEIKDSSSIVSVFDEGVDSALAECKREKVSWTENEDELLLLCHEKGKNIDEIANVLGRSQKSIMLHLAEFEKAKGKFSQEEGKCSSKANVEVLTSFDYSIENMGSQCFILDKDGKPVYSTDGRFKIFHGKLYHFNYKSGICFTVKDMVCTNGVWEKSTKKLVAYMNTNLFSLLDENGYIDQIEDFHEDPYILQHQIRVCGKWYDYYGKFIRMAVE